MRIREDKRRRRGGIHTCNLAAVDMPAIPPKTRLALRGDGDMIKKI